MFELTKTHCDLINGGRPPISDYITWGAGTGGVVGILATNAATGAAYGGAVGAALGFAAGAGYAVGTLINNHVVEPYIVRPWIMRPSS